MFHGPIRTQVGIKPLYRARGPSLRTVCFLCEDAQGKKTKQKINKQLDD